MSMLRSVVAVAALSVAASLQLGCPRAASTLVRRFAVSMNYLRAEGDTAEIDVAKVTDLLGERSELREQRDWEGADAVRDVLTEMGVTVLDREQTWFVDRPQTYQRGTSLPTEYSRREGDTAEIDVEQVEALIAERSELRRERNWEAADEVRAELTEMNVMVLDQEGIWFVRRQRTNTAAPRERDFGPNGHDYSRAKEDATELDEETLVQIHALLKERLEKKMCRSFDEADEVLAQLRSEFSVNVHDGMKSWRADGIRWGPPGYERAADDAVELADVPAVEALVAERTTARRKRDFATADALRDELQRVHGVFVDDKTRTWRARSPRRPPAEAVAEQAAPAAPEGSE